jgi:hypothetical protein
MRVSFERDIHVVVATDGRWHRYWAVASTREQALETVARFIPSGYEARLTHLRLTPAQVAVLKLRTGEAKELMYQPE